MHLQVFFIGGKVEGAWLYQCTELRQQIVPLVLVTLGNETKSLTLHGKFWHSLEKSLSSITLRKIVCTQNYIRNYGSCGLLAGRIFTHGVENF